MRAPRLARYEWRDVPPRAVILTVAGLFATMAVSAGIVAALVSVLSRDAPARRPLADWTSSAGPPLEIHEGAGRAALDAAARQRLDGYAWVDRAAGRVRIPIDRAMQVLAERGWPDRDAAPERPPENTP